CFFFSSRRRHTRSKRDWSSDVCSSDLNLRLPRTTTRAARALLTARRHPIDLGVVQRPDGPHYFAVTAGTGFDAHLMADTALAERSEERRVGKEWRTGWSAYQLNNITWK